MYFYLVLENHCKCVSNVTVHCGPYCERWRGTDFKWCILGYNSTFSSCPRAAFWNDTELYWTDAADTCREAEGKKQSYVIVVFL